MARERIYEIWRLMVGRCHNPNWNNYFTKTYYKDKGITVCDEWRYDFSTFKEWAFNNGYSDTLSIDRINSNGNYEPFNCRWITLEENRNRARKGIKRKYTKTKNTVGKYEIRYASYFGWHKTIMSGLTYSDANKLLGELMKKHKYTTPKGFWYHIYKTDKKIERGEKIG